MTATLTPKAETPHRGRPAAPVPVRTFRPDIEGLRAIAVVVVVLFHAGVPFLPGGYVGVDIFFVISGFLITTHLLSEVNRNGRIALAAFYARRARRLLPLAALVLILTIGATRVLVSYLQTRQVAVDAIWTALFAMNIRLAVSGVDYQANQDPSPLQHFWSLAVEEQFYLLWPLIMIALAALTIRRRGGAPSRWVLTVGMSVIAAASFAYCIQQTATAETVAYFIAPTRAWELALGGLIATAAPFIARQRVIQNGYAVAAGLLMIGVAIAVFDEQTPFPGYWALLPALGCALVIAAGLRRATNPERFFLGQRPMQGIGRVSYGWYLWHWPLLILATWYLEDHLTVAQGLGLTAIALWLSICSYIAIENPLRSLPTLVRRPRNSLLVGVCCILLSLAAAVAAINVARPQGGGDDIATVSDASQIPTAVEAGTHTIAAPGNLNPGLDTAEDDKPDLGAADGISCMVGLMASDISSDPGGSCVAGGTENGATTVVLTGDSHAYQWVPALKKIAVERNWRLISMTKSGCALYDVAQQNAQLKREYTECYVWRARVLERIQRERPALIITSGAIFSERKGDFSERWVSGVASTTARLVATGASVVTIEDTPYPKRNIPKCVAKNLDDVRECTLPRTEALSDRARRIATGAAARAAGSLTINPTDWFCGQTVCPVIVGNTLLYNDNSHVSATYSAQISPLLDQVLPPIP